MTAQTFVFECSSSTYLDCVEKNLFGSNKPWPLEIKAGDYCLLHHYEIGGLPGLWQARSSGGKNIVLENQSRTLATLRDTLLPNLLTGELSVAAATQATEQA